MRPLFFSNDSLMIYLLDLLDVLLGSGYFRTNINSIPGIILKELFTYIYGPNKHVYQYIDCHILDLGNN